MTRQEQCHYENQLISLNHKRKMIQNFLRLNFIKHLEKSIVSTQDLILFQYILFCHHMQY